jgi:hypothetical protein
VVPESNVGTSPFAHLIELGSDIVVPPLDVVNSTKYSSITLFNPGSNVIVKEDKDVFVFL